MPVDPTAFLVAAFTILSILGMLVYGRRYISSQSIKAQLDAKDAVIATNRQTIDAFETRMTVLQDQIDLLVHSAAKAEAKIADNKQQLDTAVARYRELERWAAPQAVGRLEATIEQLHAKRLDEYNEIITRLTRIEQKS